MKRKMICLESIIGTGKTTQIVRLYNFLSPDAALIPELNQFSPLKDVIQDWKTKTYSADRILFERNNIIAKI